MNNRRKNSSPSALNYEQENTRIRTLQERQFRGQAGLQALQDLEELIVGQLLSSSIAFEEVVSELDEELFFYPIPQGIVKVMLKMYKENITIDMVSFAIYIQKNKSEISHLAGYDVKQVIQIISDYVGRVVTTSNIHVHIRALQENNLRNLAMREIQYAMMSYADEEQDVFETTDKLMSNIESRLRSFSKKQIVPIKETFDRILQEQMKIIETKDYSGIPTDLTLLDNVTNGWQKTDLIIVAGRPAMGKTSLAITFARNPAINHNKPVAIFSLEMSADQLIGRMQAIESGVNVSKIVTKRMSMDDVLRIQQSSDKLREAPIYIDDTAGINLMELRAKSRQLVKEKGVELIIVDYLQLITVSSANRNRNREQEIGEISRGLKQIAKELKVPVIALSQLSRSVEQRGGAKKPSLSDLRESGQIEQDADMIIFCYRPEYYDFEEYIIEDESYPTNGLFLALIAKHRNGSLGDIPLKFIHARTAIENDPTFIRGAMPAPQFQLHNTNALKSFREPDTNNQNESLKAFSSDFFNNEEKDNSDDIDFLGGDDETPF